MRLVTRSDFDGLACGALLKEAGIIDSWKFAHPKDLQDGLIEVDENDTSTGNMMTLHFRVKENAPDGSYHITFKYERDKAVSYLKDGKILTKNLLIDGAEITLKADKVVKIETYPDDQRQASTDSKPITVWIFGAIGASVVIAGCVVGISVFIKHNKRKKWTKI